AAPATRTLSLHDALPICADGEPSPAPEPGVQPPFACFGAPHVVRSHFVLPPGGEAGRTSFHCLRRVFRVLATKVEQSVADQKRRSEEHTSELQSRSDLV